MKKQSVQDVYDFFYAEGEYREVDLNSDEIAKMLSVAKEDAEYVDFLLQQKKIHWRAIYTLYYDVLRSLCESLVRTDGIKVSNHQGCFAYICVKFSDLELDWDFFEAIRTARNRTKYEGKVITEQDWRRIEVQMKLYVSTIERFIEEKI